MEKEKRFEFILICVIIAMCVLVIGMQVRYNRLVVEYNKQVPEFNQYIEENCQIAPQSYQQIDFSKFDLEGDINEGS